MDSSRASGGILAIISDDEEKQFKKSVKYVLALTETQLTLLLTRTDFVEVKSE